MPTATPPTQHGQRRQREPSNIEPQLLPERDKGADKYRMNKIPEYIYPQIKLFNSRGDLLNTETNLQRSIRLAKICSTLGLEVPDKTIGLWSVPKFTVPSRPDFSRYRQLGHIYTGPWMSRSYSAYTAQRLRKLFEQNDDHSISAESLPIEVSSYLENSPRDPSAAEESSKRSLLSQIPAPPKVYLPIVNGAYLHEKVLEQTDKREPVYEFPGWCFGCRLEHGQSQWVAHPSYDPLRDRPVRVGGGFAYMIPGLEPGYMAAINEEMDKEAQYQASPKMERRKIELPKMYRADYKPFEPKFKTREATEINKSYPSANEGNTKSKERLYHAPNPFQLKKNNNSSTVAQDPFSKERDLKMPRDTPFSVQKSNTPLTQFVNVHAEKRPRKKYKDFEVKKPTTSVEPAVKIPTPIESFGLGGPLPPQSKKRKKRKSKVSNHTDEEGTDDNATLALQSIREDESLDIFSRDTHRHDDSGNISDASSLQDMIHLISYENPTKRSSKNSPIIIATEEPDEESDEEVDEIDISYIEEEEDETEQELTSPVSISPEVVEQVEESIVTEEPVLFKEELELEEKSISTPTEGVEEELPVPQVRRAPLIDNKPKIRWVVNPLEVADHVERLTIPQPWLPEEGVVCDSVSIHEDFARKDIVNNKVHGNIIVSKEFIPVIRIIREILESVVNDVLSKIGKKKAPTKKMKSASKVVRVVKKKEEPKSISPSPTPSVGEAIPQTPTPLPPTPELREPTPPPKPLTPIITPPPPMIEKPPAELPPLPEIVPTPPVKESPTPVRRTPKSSSRALSSTSQAGSTKMAFSRISTGSSFIVSPTPPPSQSPEMDFIIQTRSPTQESIDVTLSQAATLKPIRHVDLTAKVGNNWTFRREIGVTLIESPDPPANESNTNPPLPELPEIIVEQKTPSPEPVLLKKRERKIIPKAFSKMRNINRTSRKKPKSPVLTKKELKQITDPLDYLAKYCLIHVDRLPVYERIFMDMISRQNPKYHEMVCYRADNSIHLMENDETSQLQESEPQRPLLRSLAEMQEVPNADLQPGLNKGDFHTSKLVFTIDNLTTKYESLIDDTEKLEFERDTRMARLARKMFPEILSPGYDPNAKSKKKKKQKDIAPPPTQKVIISDSEVLERLNVKQKQTLGQDTDIYKMNLHLSRMEEKIEAAERRLEELEMERREMSFWAQEIYLTNQDQTQIAPEYRRKQSAMYNKLNPDLDYEMNLDEVEEALNRVNGHLTVSKSEVNFILHILDIPGRKRINFKTFACIAALSEKVAQLHPSIRKLINKFNYEALDIKMEKCKELFYVMCDTPAEAGGTTNDSMPTDTISLMNLCVELMAGGLSEENQAFVTNKFTRVNKNYVEYMDFLTYVPLFVELHDRIVTNPLAQERVN